jgi:alpha-D-xyloside xylohydrolase
MKEYEAALQNQPVDVSEEFAKQQNHFFVGSKVSEFDPNTAFGKILWKGLALKQRVSYHQITLQFENYKVWEDTPPEEYEDEQALPFSLSFVTPRTVRLRMAARPEMHPAVASLMLDGDPPTFEMAPTPRPARVREGASEQIRPEVCRGWPKAFGQRLDVPTSWNP